MSYAPKRQQRGSKQRGWSRPIEQEFTCINCDLPVSCAPSIAGVQNRNHCPYCLWSRHLDWRAPGDRLCACRRAMQPVGLTTKRSRNKYARERDGELMLIHRCTGCGQVVINRVAADDSAELLFETFEDSCRQSALLQEELAGMGVELLTATARELIWRRLFGNGSPGIQPGLALAAD